ncbi:MAG: MazG nucleotide pyrophosphohydrolase domain-containing protein [Nannocystaceae bacterium]|nr:hypothetical protein [Myxococcales bacterium]
MELGKLQAWARENYGEKVGSLSLDYGVARLLTQSGQLGEAVLKQHEDIDKELADVLFVLINLANRCDIDLDEALRQYLYERSPEEILERISS